MARAIVLGAREGNMGEAIGLHLSGDLGWEVTLNDCWDKNEARYEVPNLEWSEADAVVITLGRTTVTPFGQVTPTELADTIRACLTLPLLCAQEYMEWTNWGKVVFIGSYAHDHPITYGTPYCAAKAGLAMAVQTLAWEAPEFHWHIVHPYHVPGTPMWEWVQSRVMRTRDWTREEADDYARKDLKQPAMLTPLEIAQVVGFLLTNEAAPWLSGQGLNMYGGTR